MWLFSPNKYVHFTDIENCTKADQYDIFTNWAVRNESKYFHAKDNEKVLEMPSSLKHYQQTYTAPLFRQC
jgi:hypothetical protein